MTARRSSRITISPLLIGRAQDVPVAISPYAMTHHNTTMSHQAVSHWSMAGDLEGFEEGKTYT